MNGATWVALILAGGLSVPTAVFLLARKLVYRQTDPARGEAYLQWFRAEKNREQVAARQRTQQTAPAPRRQKELTYR